MAGPYRFINTPNGIVEASEADRRSGQPTGLMPDQAAKGAGTAYTGPTGGMGFVGANPAIGAGNMTAEEALYRQGAQGLQNLSQGATAQFAPGAAAQAEALRVLGQRAGNLQDSAAAQAAAAGREQAQAQAAPAAILGGQLGTPAAQSAMSLAREGEQRWDAYAQTLQQMGAGNIAEAEQRRLLEAAQLRDLQARYAAAQGVAAQQRAQQERSEQQGIGTLTSLGGAALGFIASGGNPLGAAAGMKLGNKLGGG